MQTQTRRSLHIGKTHDQHFEMLVIRFIACNVFRFFEGSFTSSSNKCRLFIYEHSKRLIYNNCKLSLFKSLLIIVTTIFSSLC